jgi:hypothetical protein
VISRAFLGFGEDKSPEKMPTSKQRKKRLKELKAACQLEIHTELKPALEKRFTEAMPSNMEWSLKIASLEEDPDGQTLLFFYSRILTGRSTYLNPQVRIELGARSDTWPTKSPLIKPYLAEAFPDLLAIKEFPVQAIAPERTFWEKVMLLHEEIFRPVQKAMLNAQKPRKRHLARHYYDLWCLINKGVARRALQDPHLFSEIAKHRAVFFNQNWMDYNTLKPGSLRLLPREDQIPSWRQDYNAMRREMFFGEAPDFDEILKTVGSFEKEFNQAEKKNGNK